MAAARGRGHIGLAKPLSDIRVLDLSRLLPGPMASLHLAEFGADVLRIEEPGRDSDVPAALAEILNRGKRALEIDLKSQAGREQFLELARGARVIVESFRPGVVDRLGIGYEQVRAINPRIVYCSISGYGQTGPHRLRSGHDINYLAASGVGDQIGTVDGPPVIPNLQIGDLMGGSLTAAMRILAALVAGEGCYIDVSMTASLKEHAVVALAHMRTTGRAPLRGSAPLSGAWACYNYYRAADGRYLAVGALEPKFWQRLCSALGRPDLEARQCAPPDELGAIFAGQPSSHWLELLRDVDCCVNLVLTLEEAL
jgi:alpha-methylacyl-CoA racemase